MFHIHIFTCSMFAHRYILDDLEGAEGTQFPSRGYYHDFYSKTTEQMERGFFFFLFITIRPGVE